MDFLKKGLARTQDLISVAWARIKVVTHGLESRWLIQSMIVSMSKCAKNDGSGPSKIKA